MARWVGWHTVEDEYGAERMKSAARLVELDEDEGVRTFYGPFDADSEEEALEITKQHLGPPSEG